MSSPTHHRAVAWGTSQTNPSPTSRGKAGWHKVTSDCREATLSSSHLHRSLESTTARQCGNSGSPSTTDLNQKTSCKWQMRHSLWRVKICPHVLWDVPIKRSPWLRAGFSYLLLVRRMCVGGGSNAVWLLRLDHKRACSFCRLSVRMFVFGA